MYKWGAPANFITSPMRDGVWGKAWITGEFVIPGTKAQSEGAPYQARAFSIKSVGMVEKENGVMECWSTGEED